MDEEEDCGYEPPPEFRIPPPPIWNDQVDYCQETVSCLDKDISIVKLFHEYYIACIFALFIILIILIVVFINCWRKCRNNNNHVDIIRNTGDIIRSIGDVNRNAGDIIPPIEMFELEQVAENLESIYDKPYDHWSPLKK